MNLIQPGTDVPGYRLFRPCRDCFVPVSKALRTSQQIPEQSAVRVESLRKNSRGVPKGLLSLLNLARDASPGLNNELNSPVRDREGMPK
jgi:hypothetical protein